MKTSFFAAAASLFLAQAALAGSVTLSCFELREPMVFGSQATSRSVQDCAALGLETLNKVGCKVGDLKDRTYERQHQFAVHKFTVESDICSNPVATDGQSSDIVKASVGTESQCAIGSSFQPLTAPNGESDQIQVGPYFGLPVYGICVKSR